ncbi:MAG: MBL fold metallo-hydrolase, partial [Merismopedia sp. SIO2A8]|nr:MBL fold metallo-hydrolase [Merismopedia sp. SIO2A8]
MGGTAYLIVSADGNILVDCPLWNPTTQALLDEHSGLRWLVLTHRGGMGNTTHIRQIQEQYQCDVLVQEQEAYLLPEVSVTTFQQDTWLSAQTRVLWTPGHSPGSSCLYHQTDGGILFTGRHLLPDQNGRLIPLRVPKTFHWFRQLRSVQRLLNEFTPDTLTIGCPGANTGFLRQQRVVRNVYSQLEQLDLADYRTLQPEPFP